MTNIEFHICDSPDVDTQRYVIKLALEAYRRHKKVHIHCDNENASLALSEALWHYSQSSFLAHEILPTNETVSAQLTLGGDINQAIHFETLIYCGQQEPEHISRFERYCFVVPANDQCTALARTRYKFFKQRGYPLQHISVSKTLF